MLLFDQVLEVSLLVMETYFLEYSEELLMAEQSAFGADMHSFLLNKIWSLDGVKGSDVYIPQDPSK